MILKIVFGVVLLIAACRVVAIVVVTSCGDDEELCPYGKFTLKQYVQQSSKLPDIVKSMNLEQLQYERKLYLIKRNKLTPALLLDDIMDVKVSIIIELARETRSVPYIRMTDYIKTGSISVENFDKIMYEYFTYDNNISHLLEVIDRMSGEIFSGQRNYSEMIVPALVKLFVFSCIEGLLLNRTFYSIIRDYQTVFFNRLTVHKSFVWNKFENYLKATVYDQKYGIYKKCKRGLKKKFYPEFFYAQMIMEPKAFSELWPLACSYRATVNEQAFKRYFSMSIMDFCKITNLESTIGLITLYRTATIGLNFDAFLKPFLWKTVQHHARTKEYDAIFADAVQLLSMQRRQFSFSPREIVGANVEAFVQRLDVYLKERFDEFSSVTSPQQFASKMIRKMKYFWKLYRTQDNSWYSEAICYAATWAEIYDLRDELYGKDIKPERIRAARFLQYDSDSENDEGNSPVIGDSRIERLRGILAENNRLMKRLKNALHPDDISNSSKLERLFIPVEAPQGLLDCCTGKPATQQCEPPSPIAKVACNDKNGLDGMALKLDVADLEVAKVLSLPKKNDLPSGQSTSTPKPASEIPNTNCIVSANVANKANIIDESFEVISPAKK